MNITLKASDKLPDPVPFPITKAVFSELYEPALVAEDPEELNCPITRDPKSLAVVLFPSAVELFPLAVVLFPIAKAELPLAVVPVPSATA